MSWTKLAAIDGFSHCGNCPPRTQTADVEMPLVIGFGSVAIFRDNEGVWQGDDEGVRLSQFEAQAKEDPDHDWRLQIDGPLYSATYQRHGEAEWVLVERGQGFA